MLLPLPNLDDRRWADLVEEGRALIPLYAPNRWTDHNISDPGITLMELIAWIAEMDIYQLNRIPEPQRRKFLSLIGIRLEPPHPAYALLGFKLKELRNTSSSLPLPATLEFEGNDPFGRSTRFRTLHEITVVPGECAAVQVKDQKGFNDLTIRRRQGEPIALFGEDPKPGTELYLGFSRALPANTEVSLFFTFLDLLQGVKERTRLLQELEARRETCRARESLLRCEAEGSSPPGKSIGRPRESGSGEILLHHSVHIVWEFLTGPDRWQVLDPAQKQVEDHTRCFTSNGPLLVNVPGVMSTGRMGQVNEELYYIRCRFVSGAYDSAPVAQSLVMNGVLAEQAVPVGDFTFAVPDQPGLETKLLGKGTGRPWQHITLPDTSVEESSFRLFTIEYGDWLEWILRPDFDASTRCDRHFLLDPTAGAVTFGDGDHGRAVPTGADVIVSYRATRAEEGNLAADTIKKLGADSRNQSLIERLDQDKRERLRVTEVGNPLPAAGGSPAETVEQATGRAIETRERPHRAVTLADCETIAMETPGVRLARASARANIHPSFPCFKAPGMITLIILPYLPADRPMPSRGLERAVSAYLNRRRVLGTRIEVVGPTYVEVAVKTKVQAFMGTNKKDVQERIKDALNRFFHPLRGGPEGSGWPVGRDVYRSEVLQVIDDTQGVDHVLSLDLLSDSGVPQCGNICLGPAGLVAAGQHHIEVM